MDLVSVNITEVAIKHRDASFFKQWSQRSYQHTEPDYKMTAYLE